MLVPSGAAASSAVVAVDRLPIVHRVDQDLAGEEVVRELAEAVRRDGQDDQVGVADDVSVASARAPGARTSTVSAMSSGGPEPDIATS